MFLKNSGKRPEGLKVSHEQTIGMPLGGNRLCETCDNNALSSMSSYEEQISMFFFFFFW